MIEYKQGNILDEEVEALVNTVNCVGVMGRGIALQFKRAWPENFKAYAAACRRGDVKPGRPFVFETGRLINPRYIINFPTKRHWRGKSRIEDIDAGLEALVAEIRRRRIESIAIPPLGAGLGGLSWKTVRGRITTVLGVLSNLQMIVYEPHVVPAAREFPEVVSTVSKTRRTTPSMTPARAALIGLMDRYLTGLMEPFITLLEVHKLLYFMQEAGEPMQLRFTKAPYGPYAENLRHLLREMDGTWLSGYGDGGDEPRKVLERMPGALEAARRTLTKKPETRKRFNRVAELVEGFESPFGLELLATVQWVMIRENARTEEKAVAATHAWGCRKRRFSTRQILLARHRIVTGGWVRGGS